MQRAAQLQQANQNFQNRDNFICHTTSVIKFMGSVMKRPEQNYRGLLCGKRYKSYVMGPYSWWAVVTKNRLAAV